MKLNLTLLVFASSLCYCESIHSGIKRPIISIEEAQIIVYVLPQCVEARARGTDVQFIEYHPKLGFNTKNYYFFELRAEKTDWQGWSGLIGHVAVNKNTGDARLVDTSDSPNLAGPELARVQDIIRSAHQIGPEEVKALGHLPAVTVVEAAPNK